MIMRNTADTLIPVTLELGGKDAFVVWEDVDVPLSIPFGGVKESEFGRFAGVEGLRACYLVKSVVEDRWWPFIKTQIPKPIQVNLSLLSESVVLLFKIDSIILSRANAVYYFGERVQVSRVACRSFTWLERVGSFVGIGRSSQIAVRAKRV
ncbi:aldehyde dehydrogenase 22a1 [Olea europaea subsp. europaea]|uniref:Aldehyde dehydrogenase 22a1 n=2 Tax=Olea europaea subsp. europaea TaxID=158383 RepID=A0A8S0VJ05_OLEEU|nr:aldehyde dehydrogenase 22a1 [Olea europaea subsp. europaea]